jgi:hypothetical protein
MTKVASHYLAMGEQRLADLRELIRSFQPGQSRMALGGFLVGELEALLADFDRLVAEIARLRARVRVEAEDVDRAGVTHERCDAYLAANGWTKTDDGGWGPAVWERNDGRLLADIAFGWENYVAECIQDLAELAERPGLDILDEMAAVRGADCEITP